ncbi:low molecular weight protein-tyrosine-phosphatase [Collimonas pratensis]|uniref:protein-tyrosine-phosphatase n=1 Tax=Collimonas pratensis TaxID=279113 RepID=A0ABN4MHA1_9BURK|nr:low molecular weight protein-tyrosine-phosphatase [Collimonas pratensis]AMP15037.1 low molecular weight phosphotyrosine phosphatase family protein [Collimonas pratensis]NKI69467.1 low molecular weight phosphotyrosine protein phosphatase [Collimonas pratensis]
MINSILIVCIGNICRCPMALAMFARKLPGVQLSSAGIDAVVGAPADPFAIELMRRRGIDIEAHRGQQLRAWHCESAELILVMDLPQKQFIEKHYPTTRGKLFRLGEYGRFDIFDPHQKNLGEFERCLTLIDRGVDEWAARIVASRSPRRPATHGPVQITQ